MHFRAGLMCGESRTLGNQENTHNTDSNLNKTNWKAEGSMEASDFEGTLPTNKELYQVRIFDTCSLCGPNPGPSPSPNPKSLRSFSRAVFSTETI